MQRNEVTFLCQVILGFQFVTLFLETISKMYAYYCFGSTMRYRIVLKESTFETMRMVAASTLKWTTLYLVLIFIFCIKHNLLCDCTKTLKDESHGKSTGTISFPFEIFSYVAYHSIFALSLHISSIFTIQVEAPVSSSILNISISLILFTCLFIS